MEWSDDAIVLSVRPHGESGAILELLTRDHGRHSGLVRGGASRRVRPSLQPGNTLHAAVARAAGRTSGQLHAGTGAGPRRRH